MLLVLSVTVLAQEKPEWTTKTYWADGDIVYGVGKAPKMMNSSLQRSTAENRARAATLKAVGLASATLRGSEIVEIWQASDGTIYALARVPKAGIEPN